MAKGTLDKFMGCWPSVQCGMNCFSILDAPRVELRLGRSLNASNIKEGDDVYFECLIQSNPAPNTIIWTRNVSYKALCLSATSWRMYNLQCVHCTVRLAQSSICSISTYVIVNASCVTTRTPESIHHHGAIHHSRGSNSCIGPVPILTSRAFMLIGVCIPLWLE